MEGLTEEYLLEAVHAVGEHHNIALPAPKKRGAITDSIMDGLDILLKNIQDRPLGLLIAQQMSLLAFGELGLAMRASENLGTALDRLAKFHRLRAPFVEISLEKVGTVTKLQLRYHLPKRSCSAVIVEGGLAMLVHLGRAACGIRWSPRSVIFPHRVKHRKTWEAFFDAPVKSGSAACFDLTDETLALETTAPDSMVADFLDASARKKLENQPAALLPVRLRDWLRTCLKNEKIPKAVDAAKAMAMSRRTLHRHLRDSGTTFQELLDQVRKNEAEGLLRKGQSVSEVAFSLGYSDTSSFCRAYRRWTGRAPGKSRSHGR